MSSRKSFLEKLPRQERFNATLYALNTLLLGSEFAMMLAESQVNLFQRISDRLRELAEEHAKNFLRRKNKMRRKKR